jgi:hypothetical protein
MINFSLLSYYYIVVTVVNVVLFLWLSASIYIFVILPSIHIFPVPNNHAMKEYWV